MKNKVKTGKKVYTFCALNFTFCGWATFFVHICTLPSAHLSLEIQDPGVGAADDKGLLAFCAVPRNRQQIAAFLGVAPTRRAGGALA